MVETLASVTSLAFMGLGPPEMIIFGVIAVLLFGSRLPSVARSAGRSFVEFKKGMSGIQDEFHQASSSINDAVDHYDEEEPYHEPSAPRFEPPQSEPQAVSSSGEDVAETAAETATEDDKR